MMKNPTTLSNRIDSINRRTVVGALDLGSQDGCGYCLSVAVVGEEITRE